MSEKMTPPVDCIGLALDLETQEKRVMSQTTKRAMLAAAQGLRRIDTHLATPAQTVGVEAVRLVITQMHESGHAMDYWADKLSQAIGDKT